jgi:hypothetical protein
MTEIRFQVLCIAIALKSGFERFVRRQRYGTSFTEFANGCSLGVQYPKGFKTTSYGDTP